ncbi:hypothetical protein [Ruminococcus flavefaciens]|uniref:hypothetical protein n=1 Tax=Ruminococcus flavefaciens TaxID=1265 RepID=UPI0026F0D227|nr:hypothetical protein [Ruminococcus flavefaciens]
MSFKKIKRGSNDPSKEIDYLKKSGYKNPMGSEIDNLIRWLTVDEENDAFLILTGGTNPNRDNVNLYYYVLCVNGTPITLTVAKDNKGSAAKCNAEFNWIIESIEYPDGYVPEDEEKIRGLIKEAFIVESYSELFNHERVKNVSVRFEC